MNIVIFGANGPTGRLAVSQALDAGHTVTAVTRNPDAAPTTHKSLTILRGDVFNRDDVDRAVSGADAVLSTLGVPYSNKEIRTYSRGTQNIIAAMKKHRVRRLLITSSSATDPAVRFKSSGGGALLEVMKPLVIFVFGRTTYADMRRAEALVEASDLDWTIVRPSGLFNTESTSEYIVGDDHVRGAFTSRADLAHFMVTAATDNEWARRRAAVATTTGTPNVLEFMKAEALS